MQDIHKQFISSTLELIGKKWIINIIRDMMSFGLYPKRFKDILSANQGLTTKVLASKLRELEDQQIVAKIVTPTKPSITMYVTTTKGRDLATVLGALSTFGLKWFQTKNFIEDRKINFNDSVLDRRSMNGLLKHFSLLTMNIIRGKWTLELITDLRLKNNQAIRFTDFLNKNDGLSRKVLAERLKFLDEEGLITRSTTLHNPRTVEYHLTDKGRDLDKTIYEFSVFGLKWLSEDLLDEKLTNRQIGKVAENELDLNPMSVMFKEIPTIEQINLIEDN